LPLNLEKSKIRLFISPSILNEILADYRNLGFRFFHINQYTARDTAAKGYGDLVANIGPTSEKPFTNSISNQSFNCSKESVFRQFRTSHASHSWEALSNHMWSEKPIQAG